MHAGLALDTDADSAAAVVVGYRRRDIRYGWRAERAYAPALGGDGPLHLLNLVRDLLGVHGVEDVGRRSRQQGEHGEGAILLVLFEAPTQAAKCEVLGRL